MTDRDRLIESIEQAEGQVNNDMPSIEQIADHILANGWTRPPCEVGDSIYIINQANSSIEEFIVHSISIVFLKDNYKSVKVQFVDEYGHRNFDYQFNGECFGKTVFLTKEEAEAKLKERDGNG